jgi:hypothetical protein
MGIGLLGQACPLQDFTAKKDTDTHLTSTFFLMEANGLQQNNS